MTALGCSNSNFIIRRATVNDAGLLAEFGARTFSEAFAAYNTAADMSAYLASSFSEAQQAAELVEPNSTVYLAETEGVAVGYAMLSAGIVPACVTAGKSIEMVRLYVSRDQLGQGVGAGLMRLCIDEAGSRGYQTLWLGVWENNHRALAFYRKWNFDQVGTHIFQLGNDSQTDILMQRAITGTAAAQRAGPDGNRARC